MATLARDTTNADSIKMGDRVGYLTYQQNFYFTHDGILWKTSINAMVQSHYWNVLLKIVKRMILRNDYLLIPAPVNTFVFKTPLTRRSHHIGLITIAAKLFSGFQPF